jgi:uncharacterized RDD family membrane protein YckC
MDLVVFMLVRLTLSLVGGRVWGREADTLPAFTGMVVVFTLLFSALYSTVLHAIGGQTLGKLVVGIRVVGIEGEPLTAGAALLRWFAYGVSLAPLGAGFLMAGLRRDKRALHDLIAGTRVERVEAPVSAEPVGEPAPV